MKGSAVVYALRYKAKLFTALVLGGLLSSAAQASIVPNGSPLTMILTNPFGCADTVCTTTTTFQNGVTQTLTGGLQLTTEQVADGASSEWDVWKFSTPDGQPIAGDVNSDWAIDMNYDLSKAVNFNAVVDQWTVGGVAVTPLSNFGSICCASATNPILPGEAFYGSGFGSVRRRSILLAQWDQIFVNPYNFVTSAGIPTLQRIQLCAAFHASNAGAGALDLGDDVDRLRRRRLCGVSRLA